MTLVVGARVVSTHSKTFSRLRIAIHVTDTYPSKNGVNDERVAETARSGVGCGWKDEIRRRERITSIGRARRRRREHPCQALDRG